MLRRLFSILIMTLISLAATAQELNCKVNINHDKITGVDNEVFVTMQRSIIDFMNGHKWTNDDFATNEKIDVTVFINITGNKINGDPDAYTGTLSIQASRPVYSSGYTTALVNYVDRDLVFKFTQYGALSFDDNRVSGVDAMQSNLTAVLGYYAYIIIGLDYDSYALEGGTNYFKKAQNVVNNAPEQGKSISGWKAVEGTRNRYWLADQLLNTRFADMRSFWYSMHREGLDSMYTKPTESRTRILFGLKKLYNVNRENPTSMLMQFFFAAKSEEIIHLLASTPKSERGQYITLLNSMDVPNAQKYNNLK
ncbi:DUF4835 domain-containing protein [Flavipsychrobacter stenotrophus]|uniref:DUF4835 domain-containing protein n=1 Tax=Flavipsychrobacter stenotrophus TaxID=2077091 RepID=A0A2S7SXW4_9BACT|nr:DUF4835 family protein [Flavipsychrobacter stenotrophus]PQJ11548.1 DUF4835 domain-containing protein [Flavipsychrobacter stenotrophus]